MVRRKLQNLARTVPARWCHTVKVALLLAALGVSAVWVAVKLENFARAHQAVTLTWDAIQISPPPHWIAIPLKQRVLEHSPLPRKLSVLAPDVAQRLAHAFSLEPWVRRVVEVRLRRKPACFVTLEYREPVAVVACKGELIPIDADAVVLPVREITTLQPYPRVLVSRARQMPAPGIRWESVQVQAAARVAAFLHPYQNHLRIVAINATLYRGDAPPTGPIELLSAGGSRITWGRPPGTSYSGELAAEIKLQRLLDYVEQFGSLEAPSGPYEIDVTRWTGMVRRKVGSSPWRPARGS